MKKYIPIIGLEIHVELKTNSKMFCACKNDPDETRPNFNICPVCAGHPGTLPAPNEQAIKKVIKTGLALNCEISRRTKFDRKNYFYPDLPKGYQISQYDKPLCKGGYLEIQGKKIRINRIHLEEDTGSLIHSQELDSREKDYSLVNFNRAGIPLMELVTEPDIRSGLEASLFAQELQRILRYLDVSLANMEKGQMRVEVNISLTSDEKKLGTKVEIKNLNSFKAVEKAVDFEIERQEELLEKGEEIIQETRGWDEKKGRTFSQREKEYAFDYRYFPEPDIPELFFSDDFIEEIRTSLPELPEQKRKRFKRHFGLEDKIIEFFVDNKDLSEYFEKVLSELIGWCEAEAEGREPLDEEEKKLVKLTSNYLVTDVKGLLGGREFKEEEFKITPENFAEFIKMIHKGEISSKIAKIVLSDMFHTGSDPSIIVEENQWRQVSDESEIEKILKEVIQENQKAVQDYQAGKENALQFLVGKVLSKTGGTANPQKVRELLYKLLH